MPISFPCSECGTTIKAPDQHAGKKCKCPKCAVVNLVPAAEEDDAVLETPRKVKSLTASVAAPATKIKKKASIPDETDEAPADDAPDGEADRKSRKRKGEEKKGGKGLLILVGCAVLALSGLVVAGAGGGGLWWYLSSRSSSTNPSPTASNDPKGDPKGDPRNDPKVDVPIDPIFEANVDAYYYPSGAQEVFAVRFADYLATPFQATWASTIGGGGSPDNYYADMFGVPLTSLERVVLVVGPRNPPTPGRADSVTVKLASMKGPIKSADIMEVWKTKRKMPSFTPTKAGKYTIQVPYDKANCFAQVGIRTVLYGEFDDLKTILERDQEAEVSPGLKSALAQTDFRMMEVRVKDPAAPARSNPEPIGMPMPMAETVSGIERGQGAPKPIATIWYMSYATDITCTKALVYQDANTADRAKQLVDKNLVDTRRIAEFAKQQGRIPFEYKATLSGNTVIVEQKMSGAQYINDVKKANMPK
jgi:hypothetical protein